MGIFVFEDENVKDVRDVVEGMFEATTVSQDGEYADLFHGVHGELRTTLPEDSGAPRFEGHMICDMDWADDCEEILSRINSALVFIAKAEDLRAVEEYMHQKIAEYEIPSEGHFSDFFEGFLYARARRVWKLEKLRGPQFVTNHEVKAFTFYWVLRFYYIGL